MGYGEKNLAREPQQALWRKEVARSQNAPEVYNRKSPLEWNREKNRARGRQEGKLQGIIGSDEQARRPEVPEGDRMGGGG